MDYARFSAKATQIFDGSEQDWKNNKIEKKNDYPTDSDQLSIRAMMPSILVSPSGLFVCPKCQN